MKLRKIFSYLGGIRTRSSAGRNATPWQLLARAIPMVMMPGGYSLPPLSAFFIVNSRCNMRCRLCDVGQGASDSNFFRNMVATGAEMTQGQYRSIVGQLHRSAFVSITSTEPLLWSPLEDAVDWTVTRGREINVTTNGLLLPGKAAALVEAGLTKLTVSVDGPEEVHDSGRGVSGAYRKAMEGIRMVADFRERAESSSPRILVNTVLSPLNQGRLEEFLRGLPMDLIDSVNIELMTFCTAGIAEAHNLGFGDRFHASETCLSGGVSLESFDADMAVADVKRARALHPDKVVIRFPLDRTELRRYFFEPGEFLTSARCIFPWFTAQVNPRGDLIGLTRCYPVTLGNVLELGFAGAWNGPEMRTFRQFLRHERRMPGCSRCEGMLYDW